jgi:outer membrane protein OmpA-like peptidoglycan-associated protein
VGNRAFGSMARKLAGGEGAGIGPGGVVHPAVARAIASAKGSGHALDASARERISPHVGDPLTDVRVHTDAEADKLARAVSARAFTIGSDVYFAAGEYRPGTSHGESLLTHELTHVAQQRGASAAGDLTVSDPGDALEVEAEHVAQGVAAGKSPGGRAVARAPLRASRAHIQRQAKAIPTPAVSPEGGVVWFAPWAWCTGHESAVGMAESTGVLEPAAGTTHGIIAMGLSSAYWTPHGGGEAGTGTTQIPFSISEEGKLFVSDPGAAFSLTIPNYESTVDTPTKTQGPVQEGKKSYDSVWLKFGFKWHRSEQVSTQKTDGSSKEHGKSTTDSHTTGGEVKVEGSSEEKGGGGVGPLKGEVTEKQGGSATVSHSDTHSEETSDKSTDSTSTSKTTTGPGPTAGDGVFSWVLQIKSPLHRPVELQEDFFFPYDKDTLTGEQVQRLRAIATGTLPEIGDEQDQDDFRAKLKAGKYTIKLKGFASTQGKPEKADYNQHLSERRCRAVAGALSRGTNLKAVIEDVVPIGDIAAAADPTKGGTDLYQKVTLIVYGEKTGG